MFVDIEDVIEPKWRRNSVSFARKNPHLVAEWCMKRNCGWGPEDFTHASTVKPWWICPDCNREYKQIIHARSNGHGCPYCVSKAVCSDNSFAILFNDIALQWHPTKNKPHKPDEFTWASNFKAWWCCPASPDHIWKAPITNRTSPRSTADGCPFCSSNRVSVSNSLATLHPEIAAQWHPTRNKQVSPEDITAGATSKFWWICKKGHSFQQSASDRLAGYGCGYCAGKKVSAENSLAALFPSVAREWHPKKNGDRTARQVTAKSATRAWWQCKKNPAHEWEAKICNRTSLSAGCPLCSGLMVSDNNSLVRLFPELAKQWHPTKNNKRRPSEFSYAASYQAWWHCPAGPDHVWQAKISTRTKSRSDALGCSFCAGRKVSQTNSLAALASKELLSEWDQQKNKISPDQITAGSNKKVWWRCKKGHSWRQPPYDRASKGTGCPFCSGKRVAVENSLAVLFPRVATEWHPTKNGNLKPKHFTGQSSKDVWWQCDKKHEWQQKISLRTVRRQNCPYCANKRVCADNSLAAVCPELAKQWHPTLNGTLSPSQIISGFDKKVWWLCEKVPNHEWQRSPYDRQRRSPLCPFCSGKPVLS